MLTQKKALLLQINNCQYNDVTLTVHSKLHVLSRFTMRNVPVATTAGVDTSVTKHVDTRYFLNTDCLALTGEGTRHACDS